jgi:DNA-binding CsgD family transcriptional regulator
MGAVLGELPDCDLRAALRVLRGLAEQSVASASFVDAALEQLTSIVASDLTTLSICDLERGSRRVVGRKAESLTVADRAAFDRHFRQHPLVRFHSTHPGGPTQRISDCMSVNTFRNSALHADYYRRIGINFVMALPLRIDSTNVISVVFNRGHADFNDHERAILDVIRYPLAATYRNLVVCEEAGIGLRCVTQLATGAGWQMARVTLSGRLLDASPGALRLLARFFPDFASGSQGNLPPLLLSWFARSRNWGLERPALHHGENFTLSRLGSRLVVHVVPDPDDPAGGFLLMKAERLDLRADHLAQLPLTGRERDVLALVGAGKTNGEIAIVLAISARTVQKHLEHIFQKLGVETRTAAAVCALAAADQHAAH